MTTTAINISGIIPINPVKDPLMIEGIIWVVSFMAVGEITMKTPTLQIKISKI